VPVGAQALCWLCRRPLPKELLEPPPPRPYEGPLLRGGSGAQTAPEAGPRQTPGAESAATLVALGIGIGAGSVGAVSMLAAGSSRTYVLLMFALLGAVCLLFSFAALQAAD